MRSLPAQLILAQVDIGHVMENHGELGAVAKVVKFKLGRTSAVVVEKSPSVLVSAILIGEEMVQRAVQALGR